MHRVTTILTSLKSIRDLLYFLHYAKLILLFNFHVLYAIILSTLSLKEKICVGGIDVVQFSFGTFSPIFLYSSNKANPNKQNKLTDAEQRMTV